MQIWPWRSQFGFRGANLALGHQFDKASLYSEAAKKIKNGGPAQVGQFELKGTDLDLGMPF